jgi:5-methylthioadenosine/S-adenosylhomocysteine deaminase
VEHAHAKGQIVVSDTNARSNVDILVTGCDIVTLDEENTVLRDGAIAIDGGRIVWIGKAADASPIIGAFPPSTDGTGSQFLG